VFSYAYTVDASSFLNAENVQLITEKKRKNGTKKRAKRLKEKSKTVPLWQKDLILLWIVTACQMNRSGMMSTLPRNQFTSSFKTSQRERGRVDEGRGCNMNDGLKHLTVIETENESTLFNSQKFKVVSRYKLRNGNEANTET